MTKQYKKPTIELVEDAATKKAKAMLAATTADDLPEFVEALADTIRKLSVKNVKRIDDSIPIHLSQITALRDNDHLWGYELWLWNDEDNDLCVKLLVIDPEAYGSLHSHETKQEQFFLLSGEIDLYICKKSRVLVTNLSIGQGFEIKPYTKHRICNPSKTMTALLLEVSDYEYDRVVKYLPSGTGIPSFEPVETDYDDMEL